jgi:hypothetical protein
MKRPKIMNWSRLAVSAAAGLVLVGATGCQTNIGGQVMPSAYYLQDDVQYFPHGSEDKLYNERRALDQYKAGLEQPPPGQAAPPAGPASPAAPPAAAPPPG